MITLIIITLIIIIIIIKSNCVLASGASLPANGEMAVANTTNTKMNVKTTGRSKKFEKINRKKTYM